MRDGDREIIETDDGHFIYWDDDWEELKEMLEADKDRILAALREEKAKRDKTE